MTDIVDRAQSSTEVYESAMISAHVNRPRETPDADENGNRYCLSCGEQISMARIEAEPHAVRCVECQHIKEVKERK